MIPQRRLLIPILLIGLCLGVYGQEPSPSNRNTGEPSSGVITGKVVNENGQPMAGAAVMVRPINNKVNGRTTSTDGDGNFRFAGLEPALYSVIANAPAYTSGVDPVLPTSYHRIGDNLRLELVRGGAITGTVSNAFGEPVIGVRVRATLIRDAKGQPPKISSFGLLEQQADDRGIYRLFGLSPGTYLVSAGGSGFSPVFNPYESDIPTFAPSAATRDTAVEVTVRTGEDSSADIRYRGEPGHAVSGTIKITGTNGAQATLTPINGTLPLGTTYQFPTSPGFAFNGVADGEYELVAQEIGSAGPATPQLSISETKRITVKGANISGIELVPRPLASVSGRITFEPSKIPECQGKRPPLLAETLVETHRPEKDVEREVFFLRMFATAGAPEANGSFSMVNLQPGRYQFDARFYARYWYLQSITLGAPPATTAAKTAPAVKDAAASWMTLKSGEVVNNLTIKLAEGAASLRGRLPLAEGGVLPAGTAVYLIPTEADKTEDVLRFFVTDVGADGTFTLNNLAPGRYKVVAQVAESQTSTLVKLREPEAATARTRLRKTAETLKSEIELKPCQNLADYQVKE